MVRDPSLAGREFEVCLEAPRNNGRWIFVYGDEGTWEKRRKEMRRWMKELKKRCAVESASLEELEELEVGCGDCLCVCGSICHITDALAQSVVAVAEQHGAKLMIMSHQKDEAWNKVLERYGIQFRGEAAVNLMPHMESYHPRHLFLQEPDLQALSARELPHGVLFPFACTLTVDRPAVAVVKTDALCFPAHVPIGAAFEEGGKVLILGCGSLMLDKWLKKASNSALLDYMIDWLLSDKGLQKGEEPTPAQTNTHRPDIQRLAELPLFCPPFTAHLSRLNFHSSLFSFSLDRCSTVRGLRKELGMPLSNLSIIAPEFVTPLMPVRAAKFPLPAPEVLPPSLELHDLEAELQEKRQKLDSVFLKCRSLAGFVEQSGRICGIRGTSPADILFRVFEEIALYKQ